LLDLSDFDDEILATADQRDQLAIELAKSISECLESIVAHEKNPLK
tara:strand:- start:826 stop:963 length:138 start_codon:yes stop_codon:yes gene_type:complete